MSKQAELLMLIMLFVMGFILGYAANKHEPSQNQINYEEMSRQIVNQLLGAEDYVEIKARIEGKYLVYYFDAADPMGVISRVPINIEGAKK